MPRRRRNPWVSPGEILIWVLFALLLFPAGFAGWAVGHYTSLGKPPSVVTRTVTLGSTSAATTTAAATTTTTSSGGGAVTAAGKAVFASSSCASCHTFTPAGSTGTIGPNLDTAPAADSKLAHLSLAAYIKHCITDPYAYIPKGYHKGIMPATFGTSLSKTQLSDLVAFILSGTAKS